MIIQSRRFLWPRYHYDHDYHLYQEKRHYNQHHYQSCHSLDNREALDLRDRLNRRTSNEMRFQDRQKDRKRAEKSRQKVCKGGYDQWPRDLRIDLGAGGPLARAGYSRTNQMDSVKNSKRVRGLIWGPVSPCHFWAWFWSFLGINLWYHFQCHSGAKKGVQYDAFSGVPGGAAWVKDNHEEGEKRNVKNDDPLRERCF